MSVVAALFGRGGLLAWAIARPHRPPFWLSERPGDGARQRVLAFGGRGRVSPGRGRALWLRPEEFAETLQRAHEEAALACGCISEGRHINVSFSGMASAFPMETYYRKYSTKS